LRNEILIEGLQQLKTIFPGVDPYTLGLVVGLSNSYHILYSIMERRYAKTGVTPQAIDILFVLHLRWPKGCSLAEIGSTTLLSPANVSGLVERLVRKELVTREENPADRRKKLVLLTSKGIDIMDYFIPDSANFLQELFSSLRLEDRKQLQELLFRLSEMLIPHWGNYPATLSKGK